MSGPITSSIASRMRRMPDQRVGPRHEDVGRRTPPPVGGGDRHAEPVLEPRQPGAAPGQLVLRQCRKGKGIPVVSIAFDLRLAEHLWHVAGPFLPHPCKAGQDALATLDLSPLFVDARPRRNQRTRCAELQRAMQPPAGCAPIRRAAPPSGRRRCVRPRDPSISAPGSGCCARQSGRRAPAPRRH